MDPFVHLHVASGHSLRHGASHPHQLVERAVDHGMEMLALTDRDSLGGAVRFAKTCMKRGIRPVLGVDLALAETAGRSDDALQPTPARGGRAVDRPGEGQRVTLLAERASGWGRLCRLVTATHLAGERGAPVTSLDLIAEHVQAPGDAAGGLVVMLGPTSRAARLLARRRPDLAAAELHRWRDRVGPERLVVEVVCHLGPGEGVTAGRWAAFAAEQGLEVVLTNVVRHADRSDAVVADVLDAVRRLAPLAERSVDRRTGEAYLKPGKEMELVAHEVARHAGWGPEMVRRLLSRTRTLAERCVLDPVADLGIGGVQFPELKVSTGREGVPADTVLREQCLAGATRRGMATTHDLTGRLEDELEVVRVLGYPTYFLTVADVVQLIRDRGIRCAARGSGAGSLIAYLLGISDVDPLRYGLLMERFLSVRRKELPDIDIDVESARRTEIYEAVLTRYGAERTACMSMAETYRARHALRDVGTALGIPPGEVDAIAKAFPHIRANQVRTALRELPELRASGLDPARLDVLLRLVERLDGLPRHLALHPCGVVLSDITLLERTPVEASYLGFPMSPFDKDDVEDLGLLKLDLLGIRMQSAIAHALREVERVTGERPDIDGAERDDPATYDLIRSTKTLGCFQIESPGQRELIGKFAPGSFEDVIIDISLFRPGPVKSDMIRPFLQARQGWTTPDLIHPDLEPFLGPTCGVVVFHEQILQIIAVTTGITLAEADEYRRALGNPEKIADVERWYCGAALELGYELPTVERLWAVLLAFGSFGFCKAHAAAFALPTFQSAWLKAHHTAAFLAGVLTHDPGMYPKRLVLADARQFGIAILGLDVNESDDTFRLERMASYDEPPPAILQQVTEGGPRQAPDDPRLPDARGWGIRVSLADVKGINDAEVARIVAGQPFHSLTDFWHRAGVSRPVVERLVVAGAFDSVYGLGSPAPVRRRGVVSRRDLLLQLAELDLHGRAAARAGGAAKKRVAKPTGRGAVDPDRLANPLLDGPLGTPTTDVRLAAARQARGPASALPGDRKVVADAGPVQLALDWGESEAAPSGLPEMTAGERIRAELDVLGLDASAHVLTTYAPFLAALGVTRSTHLLDGRSNRGVLVAGVKVATQTPPIRSGRRVVFLTLDDGSGPVDATFFEDAQEGYAATVFHSWLLVVRGTVRRTGPRGLSLLASGAWELPDLHGRWQSGGMDAVRLALKTSAQWGESAVQGAAESKSVRPVAAGVPKEPARVYSTGYVQSPWADIGNPGDGARNSRTAAAKAAVARGDAARERSGASEDAPRKLWHSSSGSSGG